MPELPHPLGRVVNHDPRSLGYPAPVAALKRRVPVLWTMRAPTLHHGELGSGTGNAAAHALNTDPLFRGRVFTEDDAVSIYSAATRLDPYTGEYPPTDTGSSGLSVAKVLKARGEISSYGHAFGFTHFLGALQLGPVLVGIPWYSDMFSPDSRGFVHPTGEVAGGHEILAVGDDAKSVVAFQNSWGAGWGVAGGRFYMSYADVRKLLKQDGDATVLRR